MSKFQILCRQYQQTRENFNLIVGGYLQSLQMNLLGKTENADCLLKQLRVLAQGQYHSISHKLNSAYDYDLQKCRQKLAYAQVTLVSELCANLSSTGLSVYDIYNVSSKLFSLYQTYHEYVKMMVVSIEKDYCFQRFKKDAALEYLAIELRNSKKMILILNQFIRSCEYGGRVEFTSDNIEKAIKLFSELCSLLTIHVSGVDIDSVVKSQLIQFFTSLAGQRMSSPNHVSQVTDKDFSKANSSSKPNQWAAGFGFVAKDCTRKSDNTPGILGMQKEVRGAKRLKLSALI